MKRLGLVTIGQSPRADIVPELEEVLPEDVEIVEKGALDDFSLQEIERRFAPESDEDVLVTRLRDGNEVIVGKNRVLAELQSKVNALNAKGVDLIALLCAGEFPGLRSQKPLLFPNKLVEGLLEALIVEGKIAFLAPSEKQLEHIRQRFVKLGFEAIGFAASPYTSRAEGTVEEVARKIRAQGEVGLVIMTCFGYTAAMKRKVREITGKLVVSPRTLLAETLRELFA